MGFRQIRYAVASGTAIVAFLLMAKAAAMDPNQAAVDTLRTSPPGSMGAIRLTRGNGAIFCTLGSNEQNFADNERIAVLYSPEFRTWHGRGDITSYVEIHPDMNRLSYSMQNGRCSVAVESAANIVALSEELKRAGMIFFVLPSPLRPEQLADLYANSLGFRNNADLLLAAYMMVNNEELQVFFKLGIASTSAYDGAVARMKSQAYSQDRRDLMSFLKDEAEGARRHISAAEIRDERSPSTASAMQ